MIKAEIIADSITEQDHRLTTMVVTFPRFILAELNTHRMFSRNSASSRAIPFKKMVEAVQNNPFIPIAWQKEHKGMQGSEYINKLEPCNIWDTTFQDVLEFNIEEVWLHARDKAVESAKALNDSGITKQLCNRLLEPFMWHTVIITATEWENFFALRCPQYEFTLDHVDTKRYRSKKDLIKYGAPYLKDKLEDGLYWLSLNKGQAEIHTMALAEAMWDAYNESTPKELKAGEWHIPFSDDIDISKINFADSIITNK